MYRSRLLSHCSAAGTRSNQWQFNMVHGSTIIYIALLAPAARKKSSRRSIVCMNEALTLRDLILTHHKGLAL